MPVDAIEMDGAPASDAARPGGALEALSHLPFLRSWEFAASPALADNLLAIAEAAACAAEALTACAVPPIDTSCTSGRLPAASAALGGSTGASLGLRPAGSVRSFS